jgi:fructokinase
LHPEIGHFRLRRAAGDRFAGICRFHSDCIEGLVSGPALGARFGLQPDLISDEHRGWTNVAADLGELAAVILLTTSAERIVLGGSVALSRSFLLPMIRAHAVAVLGGYLPHFGPDTAHEVIVLSRLGAAAGPRGAIALADDALRPTSGTSSRDRP